MLEIWMITNQGWECVTMNQGVISWITQKQVCIVGSTIEFKNDITYLIAKKVIWMKRLLAYIGFA
jgi:hypothetical protein